MHGYPVKMEAEDQKKEQVDRRLIAHQEYFDRVNEGPEVNSRVKETAQSSDDTMKSRHVCPAVHYASQIKPCFPQRTTHAFHPFPHGTLTLVVFWCKESRTYSLMLR